jgi:hypothetical protein
MHDCRPTVVAGAFAILTRWIENGADEHCVYAPEAHTTYTRRNAADLLAASTYWRLYRGHELPALEGRAKRPGVVDAALYLLDKAGVWAVGDAKQQLQFVAYRETLRDALRPGASLRLELWEQEGQLWSKRKRKRERR